MLIDLAIHPCTPAYLPHAQSLGQALQLPVQPLWQKGAWLLKIGEHGLSLQPGLLGDVAVDFTAGKMAYRTAQVARLRAEMVVKAVAIKGKTDFAVLDATAGLGRDAFILSCVGCDVTMLERNWVVHALLADGLNRAYATPDLATWLPSHLRLSKGDLLSGYDADISFDVVYLDPMFPARQKSALVKKDMQAFHQIVGFDEDSDGLLAAALALAKVKVVVKRPASAPPLAAKIPSYQVSSKHNRFDVYVV